MYSHVSVTVLTRLCVVKLWHCALIHYCFLADPRTENVVGEPKATNSSIIKVEQESAMHFATVSQSIETVTVN